MADNNTNLIVIQQLLHVQQQQAEDERHLTAVVTQWDRHVRSDTAVVPP